MVQAQLDQMTARIREIVNKILDSGTDVQDDLADVKVMVEAANRIRDRTLARFGPTTSGVRGVGTPNQELTDEELAQILEQPSVKGDIERLHKAAGHSGKGVEGPFVDLLKQLIQAALSNPQLLQLILSLFNRSTPA